MPTESPSTSLEVILLGTGASAGVPEIGCIVKDLKEGEEVCETCFSAIDTGESIKEPKNIRGNTSAIVRKTFENGRTTIILIDCGKTFRDSVIRYWRKNGVSKLDGVLLTHLHSDATLGLDDLRSLTTNGCVQDSIDIYCDEMTLKEVKAGFPQLFGAPLGGGWAPALNWKLIKLDEKFSIGGIDIMPLAVQHGMIWQEVALPASLDFKVTACPTTSSHTPPLTPTKKKVPFMIASFIFDDELVYMSDVSRIPEESWKNLLHPQGLGEHKYPLLLLDCDRLQEMNASHLGIASALEIILRLNPLQTYLFGISHAVSHHKLELICKEIEGSRNSGNNEEWLKPLQTYLFGLNHSGSHDQLKVICKEIQGNLNPESDDEWLAEVIKAY